MPESSNRHCRDDLRLTTSLQRTVAHSRDDVTDIHFQGCREVFVERADGTLERCSSPFGSNREVEDFLARIARRAGATDRTGSTHRRAGEAGADG